MKLTTVYETQLSFILYSSLHKKYNVLCESEGYF